MATPLPAGVMDATYASERLRKPHLRFRFQTRALLAVQAFRRFGNAAPAPAVTDFGAADGLTLIEIRRLLGGQGGFLGIEYARDLVRSAPPLPPNVRLVEGDVTRLPADIAPESQDIVTALALLEHLPSPLLAVAEAARILKPGGLFVASCPVPQWDAISTRLGLLKGEHHEIHPDRATLTTLIQRAGLEFLEYRRFMFAPVSFLPYLKLPVPPGPALTLDRMVWALPLTGWSFVNQSVVARKP